jgi:hypothetical protein
MNYQDRPHVRTSFVIVALLLTMTACQNDPDPTGIGLVPEGDLINALRFDSQADSTESRHSTYQYTASHAATTMLAIGEADGYKSSALMRWLYFNVDTAQAYGSRIVSATLRLRSMPYHIGDISAPFRLEMREIKSFWNVFTIPADSVDKLQLSMDPVGVYDGPIGATDSIDIDIDSSLVRRWMTNSIEQKYSDNLGVILQSIGGGVLRSFESIAATNSHPPVLTVIIETDGVLDTLKGEGIDNTYLVTSIKREAAGRIILESGVSVRGKLSFDMSAIPPASVINHAVLYLTKDASLSTKNFRGADSVLVYETVDSSTNLLSNAGIITRIDNSKPGILIAEGTPLTRAVQNWVNRKGNYGLILVPMYEITDIDRIALYGADADADKRPRLVVTYTTQP